MPTRFKEIINSLFASNYDSTNNPIPTEYLSEEHEIKALAPVSRPGNKKDPAVHLYRFAFRPSLENVPIQKIASTIFHYQGIVPPGVLETDSINGYWKRRDDGSIFSAPVYELFRRQYIEISITKALQTKGTIVVFKAQKTDFER